MNGVIDKVLSDEGLSNEQLVLCGFSQGAAVSAYAALGRQCLAVMPFGGPCPPRQVLLPDKSTTRVCVITGDQDPYAPHQDICAAFGKYTKVDAATDGVHVIAGMRHELTKEHDQRGLAFLQSCGLE